MGFLGTSADPYADFTLIIQIIGFVSLLAGSTYIKKGNILKHTRMADLAVVLAVIALIWMVFSFISFFPLISPITGIHSIVGAIAIILGIFFISNKVITKTRMPMRIVFLLWTVAFILGLIQYYSYYLV